MIKKLKWDSDFFKKSIGSIDENDFENLRFDYLENFDLVQCCCDIANSEFRLNLENKNFHYVDTRINFLMDIDTVDSRMPILAKEEDCSQLKEIANNVFIFSRFNNSYFYKNQFKEFYAQWIENAIAGTFDDLCIIKRVEEEIVGFITLKHLKDKILQIGLLGISKKFQGSGYAAELIEDAKYHAKKSGFNKILVATQGVNIPAQRFYIKQGFLPENIKMWYYYGKIEKQN